jgi:hypothetical protein
VVGPLRRHRGRRRGPGGAAGRRDILGGVVGALVGAVLNAWVLLIEILR